MGQGKEKSGRKHLMERKGLMAVGSLPLGRNIIEIPMLCEETVMRVLLMAGNVVRISRLSRLTASSTVSLS